MDIEAPNMAFGADFEPDTDNSDFNWINCHCLLTRRSSSKVCWTASETNCAYMQPENEPIHSS